MSSHPDSRPSEPSAQRPLAADELLPPIEPPSAGFILQLFIIPAVIVAVVVLLGWLVTTLATTGERYPCQMILSGRMSRLDGSEALGHRLTGALAAPLGFRGPQAVEVVTNDSALHTAFGERHLVRFRHRSSRTSFTYHGHQSYGELTRMQ